MPDKKVEKRRAGTGFMVRLSDQQRAQLGDLAELLGLNRSSTIRFILAEELPRRLRLAKETV